MKVSIITPVLNEKTTISSTIESVLSQTYKDIEYIVVDNGSDDGTLDILHSYGDRIHRILSEDIKGIYTTMNKGLKAAKGQILGILNANDLYFDDNVIKNVVDCFEKHGADVCWGDLLYVDKKDINKNIRYWKSSEFKKGLFKKGWVPPHPSFFVRKCVYEKYGFFNLEFKLAADHELMLRFLEINRVRSHYIPGVLVRMRVGGATNANVRNIISQNHEIWKALCRAGMGMFPLFLFCKIINRIKQFTISI